MFEATQQKNEPQVKVRDGEVSVAGRESEPVYQGGQTPSQQDDFRFAEIKGASTVAGPGNLVRLGD